MNPFKLILIVLAFLSVSIHAQRDEASEILNDLCADDMYGRGYVKFGHIKAAKYIQEYYKKINLKSFKKNTYLQPFNIKANTFPNDLEISINGKVVIEGEDYMLDPASGSANGDFKLEIVDSKSISNFISKLSYSKITNLKGSAIVLNSSTTSNVDTLKIFNDLKIGLSQLYPVFWINNDKFTWSVSKEASEFPIIEIRDSMLQNADSVSLKINNLFLNDITTHNVIGKVNGKKNKTIIISAHYDHLGMMGEAIFPGANDNASGIAMLLSLAKYYSNKTPKYNLVFMAFGAEEAGILGSKYYVEHPYFNLDEIKFVVNLDIMGTGDEGITVVNGVQHKKQFKELSKINKENNYLSKIKIRGRAANSDHYWFSQLGVPAFFIYTMGGIKAYQDVYDRSSTLHLTEFDDLYQLLIDFVATF